MKSLRSVCFCSVSLMLGLLLFFAAGPFNTLAAQGTGGGQGGGGSSVTTGDQDQVRDQDRIQDPTTHTGDEPLQDRDQIRDQDRLTSTTSGDQDRDQIRDRDRVQDPTISDGDGPLQDRDQTRDRDRIHVDTPEQLKALITDEKTQYENGVATLSEEVRNLARNHNRVRVATMAFMAVENMVGPVGKDMASTAAQVNGSVDAMARVEERLQERGRFMHFFFGSDDDNVSALEGELNQNRVRIEKLNQYLNECTCDDETKTMLQEQLRIMEEEQTRLGLLRDTEKNSRGIFGVIFGWL